jgi:hypothetical protein
MGPGRGRLEKTTFTTRSPQKQNGAHHSKNTYEALSSQNDEEVKFTNIRQSMLKLGTHSGFHDLFRF